jgi:hypothetical protein
MSIRFLWALPNHYFEITMLKHPNYLMAQSKTHPAHSLWVGLCAARRCLLRFAHPHTHTGLQQQQQSMVFVFGIIVIKEYFVPLPAKLA